MVCIFAEISGTGKLYVPPKFTKNAKLNIMQGRIGKKESKLQVGFQGLSCC